MAGRSRAPGIDLTIPSPPRASFELREEDIEALRAIGLSEGGSTQSRLHAHAEEQRAFEEWRRRQAPCALDSFSALTTTLKGKRLAIFLDYDGTLTPIVSNPEAAILSEDMRDVVRNLAQYFPTAIISGRGREKVESFVQLKELYYAGSHGMDIAGPKDLQSDSQDSSFQPALHFKPLIDEVYSELCDRFKAIPGSSVEHNTFCVSAHYRNCPGDTWLEVVKAVEETLSSKGEELKITRGRKVMEIRPKVNWHKGTALNHLLTVLGLKNQPDVVSIYIGDDRTDEDAFRVLREEAQGYGILVSTKVKDTTAFYTVRDPGEVGLFLKGLVSWATSSDNGWMESYGQGAARELQGSAAELLKWKQWQLKSLLPA